MEDCAEDVSGWKMEVMKLELLLTILMMVELWESKELVVEYWISGAEHLTLSLSSEQSEQVTP